MPFRGAGGTADLVLLDIMMPEMDGYTFMRHFRKESGTPIILLTAKLEENDKVLGWSWAPTIT